MDMWAVKRAVRATMSPADQASGTANMPIMRSAPIISGLFMPSIDWTKSL